VQEGSGCCFRTNAAELMSSCLLLSDKDSSSEISSVVPWFTVVSLLRRAGLLQTAFYKSEETLIQSILLSCRLHPVQRFCSAWHAHTQSSTDAGKRVQCSGDKLGGHESCKLEDYTGVGTCMSAVGKSSWNQAGHCTKNQSLHSV
jgi:hypothetical protein